tara:strand:+ start:551 stop:805 length:255 start_codon:yes stop_codon:yes gene_type:complete
MKISKRQLRRIIREAMSEPEPGFEFEGMWVTDPSMDETGRFKVDPVEYYGSAYLDFEDQKAAEEILATRMGSYKGTTLPDGRKI